MKPNMGAMDRVLRIVVGIVLFSLVFVLEGNARWLGLVGIVPLLTAVVRWCPAYSLFGIATR